ncbi:phosphatase PAP2 family protein [uncultured Sphingomonas sp.]|uniref:phosphatase PAP2 family protein n=1 Tax=uncultured Sphingomonas sp. TaxID=158754 RepID=UPI0035C9D77F
MSLLLLFARLIDRWPLMWDRAIMLALRIPGDPATPIGPAWLLPFMRDVTALGGGLLLTLIVVAVAGLLVVRRLYRSALMIVLASWSGGQVVALVKQQVGRARPDIVPRLVDVRELSFPSGHAASSAVVYLTLAALGAQTVREPRVRTYLLACAVILVGTIGISRVYLGVHWPSDVLAGWSFGALWALGWWRLGAEIRP